PRKPASRAGRTCVSASRDYHTAPRPDRRVSSAMIAVWRFTLGARTFGVLAIAALGIGLPARQVEEPVDTAVIAAIREEGFDRSHGMESVFWLTDRYGPRLNGSPEHEEAGDWVVAQLRAWGVENVRKERFESGRGWSLAGFHATMTEPRVMPIVGMPRAWTPGTDGTVRAEVVRPLI